MVIDSGVRFNFDETLTRDGKLLWWAKGGVLRGESPTRLAFLRDILAQAPESGLDPQKGIVRHGHPCAGKAGEYYLVYTGPHRPARLELTLPVGQRYRAEVVDTWAMTRTYLPDEYSGDCIAELPGKPYTALVFRRVG